MIDYNNKINTPGPITFTNSAPNKESACEVLTKSDYTTSHKASFSKFLRCIRVTRFLDYKVIKLENKNKTLMLVNLHIFRNKKHSTHNCYKNKEAAFFITSIPGFDSLSSHCFKVLTLKEKGRAGPLFTQKYLLGITMCEALF